MACQQDLRPAIAAEAQRQGVPPEIALAVAQKETGVCHWDASGTVKIGRAGEIGVMQVLPLTAPGVDLYDPAANIRAGVGYLAAMYQRYGDWTAAVAAYNWGPGHMDKLFAGIVSLPSSVAAYVSSVLGSSAVAGDGGIWAVLGIAAAVVAIVV